MSDPRLIQPQPLSAGEFSPYGDVLDVNGKPHDLLINDGMCKRFHDRAQLDFRDGRAGVSLFDAQPRALPYRFDLVERHPLGSQTFVPMTHAGFLVIVAPDISGQPGTPRAFLTEPGQAINLHRGTWHGVLTPLSAPGLFAVVDRIGDGLNLQEYRFDQPYTVIGT